MHEALASMTILRYYCWWGVMRKEFILELFSTNQRRKMTMTEFTLLKAYIYQKCVNRVEQRRLSENKPKPQISLCVDDKSLVSNFFNCKLGHNNKYLITKRLLNYKNEETGTLSGAVPVFKFKNEHEVLWGNDEEFRENLYDIYVLLFTDILNSKSEYNELIKDVLCDNIIFAKYSSLFDIKYIYDVSLLTTFAVPDDMVSAYNMNIYLKIALKHLYERPNFQNKFQKLFYEYTQKYNDYTNIDKRLMKDFIPHLSHLLENYLPESDSLGLRVKTLIKQDVIKIIDQLKAMDAGNTNSGSIPKFV